ncbi:MAG: glycerophosphodiester phosphodiesterase [Acidimicrobiia bacterium]|nr:MAG: glycerophosphodiester phosphodiesterase [Acidimicrobiia bacterium]
MRPVLTRAHPIAAAHRGSRILWPENTMPAFQGAVDLGVHFLETDLHATNDGHLVTFHDPTLDRCTDGLGDIADWSLGDLRTLDAGANFEGEGDFPFRGRGVGIPTLEEVLTAFPDVGLVLDIKAEGVEPLLADLLTRRHAEDRVIVGSFSDRRLARFRRLTGGAVATSSASLESLKVKVRSLVRLPARTTADAFQVPTSAGMVTVVDAAFVDAAHAAGKHVHVWTINERAEMVRLLDLGVDGIVTDRPDTLMEVLAERGGGEG